jgi:uncharacterized membrane protein
VALVLFSLSWRKKLSEIGKIARNHICKFNSFVVLFPVSSILREERRGEEL